MKNLTEPSNVVNLEDFKRRKPCLPTPGFVTPAESTQTFLLKLTLLEQSLKSWGIVPKITEIKFVEFCPQHLSTEGKPGEPKEP